MRLVSSNTPPKSHLLSQGIPCLKGRLFMSESPSYFSASEVSEMLQVSRQTIRRLAREGRICASWVGRKWLFEPDSVRSFVAASRRGGR
jgi:excisionase family DNA binding protein